MGTREHRSIWWTDDRARLANFSASTKGSASSIKIELKITDPSLLGYIMTELAEIKRDQGVVVAEVMEAEPDTGSRRDRIGSQPTLRLTHRKS